MKKHLLLIGFSCTGKTSLGKEVFSQKPVDSDSELRRWIEESKGKKYGHIYEIFMDGRDYALALIAEAEDALIGKWTKDKTPKIISLGPGFPLHKNWPQLRAVSYVVLLRKSTEEIYKRLIERRKDIFETCPVAKNYDNWDVGVIVDEKRQLYLPEEAIAKIKELLASREQFYGDNDQEICTDDWNQAVSELKEIKKRLE